jgi:sterol desaturase/sphingolipid hydroxylase (fatty acid hydroxylase superfamily)
VSGITIWTAYVVVFMWLYANSLIPWLTWGASTLGMLWFVLLFALLVMFEQTRFYFVHRLLHTQQM